MDFFDILLAKKLEDDRDPKVEGLSVTANGTYSEEGVVYKPVVVNVPETPLSSLSVTANGTYTAPSGTAYDEVDVDVPLPENAYLLEEYEDVPTDIASFTASDAPLKELNVAITPQQDLHGYDSPWVGGSEKNKLPMTVDGIKAINTSGTWSGSNYTVNGVTFSIITDNGGNITGVEVNGTASASALLYLKKTPDLLDNTYYVLNGCPSNGSTNTYALSYSNNSNIAYNDIGSGVDIQKFDYTTYPNSSVYIVIYSGYTANNLLFKPMIRLASETDATFEPYSNICPISGWDEVNVVVSPTTDAEDGTTYNIQFKDGDNPLTVYGGSLDVVSGELVVDRAKITINDLSVTKSSNANYSFQIAGMPRKYGTGVFDIISDSYKSNTTDHSRESNIGTLEVTNDFTILCNSGTRTFYICDSQFTNNTAEEFKVANKDVELVYELETPQTYQLTPTAVKSLLGSNNLWASTGQIETLEYFTKETS